jgi:hypothetical protein
MRHSGNWHEFRSGGNTWVVAQQTTVPAGRTGLCFRRGEETRFLPFTRGALPSDRELHTMSEEVLNVLLQRAIVHRDP